MAPWCVAVVYHAFVAVVYNAFTMVCNTLAIVFHSEHSHSTMVNHGL